MGLFDFITDPIASIGGAVLGGLFGKDGQDSANKTNIKLSREQMNFQERMSSSAYQRAVKDMEAAGLNPMLAYSQGGASAPMGSMPNVQSTAGPAMASASQSMQVVQAMQQVMQSKAQTELMAAQARKVEAETLPNAMHSSALAVRTEAGRQQASLMFQQQLTEAQRQGLVKNQAQFTEVMTALKSLEQMKGEHTFYADVALRKAEALIKQLGIPRAEAEGDFYGGPLGEMNPYLRQLLEVARGISSIRR